jgi:hypothetical protein
MIRAVKPSAVLLWFTLATYCVASRVTDFGAKCDNSTDDTASIQKAVDAATFSDERVVGFPTGMCRTTAALTVTASDVTFQGQGLLSSGIRLDNATAIAVNVNGGSRGISGFHMRDMRIDSYLASNHTRTGGSSLYIYNCGNFTIERVYLRHGWNALVVDHSSGGLIHYVVIDGLLDVAGGGLNTGITIANTSIGNAIENANIACAATKCTAGILVDTGTDTLTISNSFVGGVGFAKGIVVQNTGRAHDPRWIRITDTFIEPDPKTGIALQLTKAYDAEVRGLYTSWGAVGVDVAGTARQVRFIGGIVQLAQTCGVLIEGTGKDIEIDGMLVTDNSQAGKAKYSGVVVASGVTNFKLKNIRSGNVLWNGAPPSLGAFQKYGIEIVRGASDHYQVLGCDTGDNVTGGMTDGGTGVNKSVANNL